MFPDPPTAYRPFMEGVYRVSAGLFRLGAQPVPWREDGQPEAHTFALDCGYARFMESKAAAHRRARACHDGGRAAQVNIAGEVSFAERTNFPRRGRVAVAAEAPHNGQPSPPATFERV